MAAKRRDGSRNIDWLSETHQPFYVKVGACSSGFCLSCERIPQLPAFSGSRNFFLIRKNSASCLLAYLRVPSLYL